MENNRVKLLDPKEEQLILTPSTGEFTKMTRAEIRAYNKRQYSKVEGTDKTLEDEFNSTLNQRKGYLTHLQYAEEKTANQEAFNVAIKENCGSFCFNIYENMLNKDYLFRFAYLCSLSGYDNYIVWGSGKNNGVVKKDLMEILNLSRAEYFRVAKYLLDNKMIIENEKRFLKVSETYYHRGKSEDVKSLKGSVRMFDKAIEEIYQKSTPKEHKKLDLLIKMLPYLNVQHNIICKNPEEKEYKYIDLFGLTELATMFGYTTSRKFKAGLFDITVAGEDVIMYAEIKGIKMICVNPRVFYKGSDIEGLKSLIGLFDIAKGTKERRANKRKKNSNTA